MDQQASHTPWLVACGFSGVAHFPIVAMQVQHSPWLGELMRMDCASAHSPYAACRHCTAYAKNALLRYPIAHSHNVPILHISRFVWIASCGSIEISAKSGVLSEKAGQDIVMLSMCMWALVSRLVEYGMLYLAQQMYRMMLSESCNSIFALEREVHRHHKISLKKI
jgi:hypothetical protein